MSMAEFHIVSQHFHFKKLMACREHVGADQEQVQFDRDKNVTNFKGLFSAYCKITVD